MQTLNIGDTIELWVNHDYVDKALYGLACKELTEAYLIQGTVIQCRTITNVYHSYLLVSNNSERNTFELRILEKNDKLFLYASRVDSMTSVKVDTYRIVY